MVFPTLGQGGATDTACLTQLEAPDNRPNEEFADSNWISVPPCSSGRPRQVITHYYDGRKSTTTLLLTMRQGALQEQGVDVSAPRDC